MMLRALIKVKKSVLLHESDGMPHAVLMSGS